MRTKIIEDNLTTDKASVIVGQDMYNKYVNITELLEMISRVAEFKYK
jgi:hypothetical protein